MAKEKYCPINSHPKSDGMCQKEKCAWWTKDEYEACVLVRIALEIKKLIPPKWVGGAR